MSQSHYADRTDLKTQKVRQGIKEQKARLRRTIAQGYPTQFADDTLRDMEAALRQIKDQRQMLR